MTIMDTDGAHLEKRHPIQVVARRTGLTPDVLRVWEKRYEVVQPGRSGGGHRLYSDRDVERLGLLHRATSAGRRISVEPSTHNPRTRSSLRSATERHMKLTSPSRPPRTVSLPRMPTICRRL